MEIKNITEENFRKYGKILKGYDIVFFSDSEGKLRVELVFDGDTVWTTQKRIAEIFQVDVHSRQS